MAQKAKPVKKTAKAAKTTKPTTKAPVKKPKAIKKQQVSVPVSPPQQNTSSARKYLIGLVVVAAAISVGWLIWQYTQARSELARYNDPKVAVETASQNTVDEVGRIMVLPRGEEPTVASIEDADKLSGRPFFSKAKNGDKVLIYQKAKKAIIYRPTTHQIVEVAAYNPAETQVSPQ